MVCWLLRLVTVPAAAMPTEGLISLPGEDDIVEAAVRYLHNKQGLDGDPLEYVDHMLVTIQR